MKVLIADKFPDGKIEDIKNIGYEVVYEQDLKDDSLLEEIKKQLPDVLVVRSTSVTGKMIESDSSLSLIIRAGSGYNTIDVKTASARSVYVANCPGKNAIAVAELAFGHLLSLDRRIPDNVLDLREGRWNKKEYSKAGGVYGKTLGIVGVGRIGQELITRAKAFGMDVVAWSRSLTPQRAEALGILYAKSPLEVASESDAVSVHLALTEDTKELIGPEFFAAMKPKAFFINTSRAEIVDEAALLKAVDEKGIRAGLDVFSGEPSAKAGDFAGTIAKSGGVYGTHHIGASTDQAQNAVADETVRLLEEYMLTGHVHNCVNLMEKTPASYMLSVHHKNRVGVLANVLDIIREANINVELMENIIFAGGDGACARIQIDGKMTAKDIEKMESSSEEITSVSQVSI
ncbi:MAG TPA: phosphoglycerate dehydrogenase [Spirochaetota bacterium]|nr:phosphoglycerate dehydrogenase [Spirochaetota bacterium]